MKIHETGRSQVLEIRTESQEVLQSLTALSKLHQQNTAASRRQLKANVEERGIANVEQFLAAAQSVIQVGVSVTAHFSPCT